jgi:hypothetical protein
MTARIDFRVNGKTREGRMLAATRRELARRLGPSPSLEARECAEGIVRAKLEIAMLERQRIAAGALSEAEREHLIRLEGQLGRALRQLERLAPDPAQRQPTLAEILSAGREAQAAA